MSPLPQRPGPASSSVVAESSQERGLDALEPVIRARLEKIEQELATARDSGAPADQLLPLCGLLGRLYLAFELPERAIEALRCAQSAAPEDPAWPYYLSLARGERDPKGALADVERAVELMPESVAAWIRQGRLAWDTGDRKLAATSFSRALEIEPESPAALAGLARLDLSARNYESAAARLEAALRLEPRAKRLHYALGQAYRGLGDVDSARRHLELADEHDVVVADPWSLELETIRLAAALEVVIARAEVIEGQDSLRDTLGYAISKLGGSPQAVAELESRLDDPRALAGLSSLARARLHYVAAALAGQSGARQAASDHLERAVRLAPELAEARVAYGNDLARQRRFADAIAQYSRVLEQAGTTELRGDVLRRRAAAQAAMGEWALAEADLEAGLAAQPNAPETLLLEARLLEQRGDVLGARQRLDEWAHDDSFEATDQALFWRALGELEQRRGDLEAAGAAYGQAQLRDAENIGVLERIAALEGHLGHYEQAIEHYRALLALAPAHLEGRLGLATALLLHGEDAAAKECLEVGLLVLPNEPTMTHLLARLLSTSPDETVRDGARAALLAQRLLQARSEAGLEETSRLRLTWVLALAAKGDFEAATREAAALEDVGPSELVIPMDELMTSLSRQVPWTARDVRDILAARG